MNLPPYHSKWRRYRRANWAAGLWLVAGFPLIVVIAIVAKLAIGEAALIAFVVLAVVWATSWAVLCLRVTRFRCPRCEGLYFAHTQIYFGAGRHCATCGLALYANE